MLAVGVRLTVDLVQRRPKVRLLYNTAAYSLSAAAAGAAATFIGSATRRQARARGARHGGDVLRRQRRPHRGGDRSLGGRAVLRPASHERVRDGGAVRDHGVGDAHARRCSGSARRCCRSRSSGRSSPSRSTSAPRIAALVATRLALTDALTGLGNQRHFYDRLQAGARHGRVDAQRRSRSCLLDVDGMKQVNDSLGHLDRRPACSSSSRRASGAAVRRSASAATSSRWCSRARPRTTRSRSPTRSSDRITVVEVVPRTRRRGLSCRPRRLSPSCSQRHGALPRRGLRRSTRRSARA